MIRAFLWLLRRFDPPVPDRRPAPRWVAITDRVTIRRAPYDWERLGDL